MVAKGWILGAGAAVVAVGAGAATWAAVSFFSAGPQAAEILPANTMAYASLDLDPSGGQKIAALKLINKFPALRKEIGLKSTDDVRRKLVESFTDDSGCKVDYAKDVEPWIGSTIAFGLVAGTHPEPAVAVEVKDADKATVGARKLLSCDPSDSDSIGFASSGDWLVFAKDDAQAQQVIAAGKEHSLADDSDFKKWTSAAGDAGILTAYAAPEAGAAFAKVLSDLGTEFSGLAGEEGFASGGIAQSSFAGDDFGLDEAETASGLGGGLVGPALSWCPGATDPSAAAARFKDFRGAGATLRFGGDGLTLQVASDFGGAAAPASSKPAEVTDLPAEVGAVFGVGFGDRWVDQLVDGFKQVCGDKFDSEAFYDEIHKATGLDAPADLETLTSRSAQLVVGPHLDVESLINSGDPSDLPVALRVMGDPAKLKSIAGKLAAALPGAPVIDTATGPDSVSVGFSSELRDQLAKGGKLGDDPDFKAVVPEADKASSVLYVDLDLLKSALEKFSGGDQELADNLKPLRAFGISGWLDGRVTHSQLVLEAK